MSRGQAGVMPNGGLEVSDGWGLVGVGEKGMRFGWERGERFGSVGDCLVVPEIID